MAVVILHLMRVNIVSLKFRIDPVISWHVQEQMVSVCVYVLNVLCECAVFAFLLKEKRFCTSVDVIKVPSHFLSCSRTAARSGSTWMGFWNKEHVMFLHALILHALTWTTSFRQIELQQHALSLTEHSVHLIFIICWSQSCQQSI